MIIAFKNWDKHQSAEIKKAVNPYWFKFRNDFFADPKICELDSEEIVTLLYMFCEASKAHKNGQFFLGASHYRISTRMSDRVLSRTLKKLKELQIVDIRQSNGSWASVEAKSSQKRIEENRREENTQETELKFGPQQLLELWNTGCGALVKAGALTPSRKKHSMARLSERPEKLYWEEIIARIALSEFCNGGGPRGWRACFDFLLKPETHIKVIEGKYDALKKQEPGLSYWAREMAEEEKKQNAAK